MTKHSVEDNSKRLLELSNEVRRIAATLADISNEKGASAAIAPDARASERLEMPDISADQVSSAIAARRHRELYFERDLFADPAWDMMLDLLEAEIRNRRVAVSSLCMASAVPASTALRWIKALVNQGLFVRRPDPQDLRRVYIELSRQTSRLLRCYFADLDSQSR